MKLQPLLAGKDAFQRIKTVKDLTKPEPGIKYRDLDGNPVEVIPGNRFNLIIDSARGLVARVIYGKVVLKPGEKPNLPFGMKRGEAERSFGKDDEGKYVEGNIFLDSRGSKSISDDSMAIESPKTYFGETSARSIAFRSRNSRFIDGMNDRAINSPNSGFYLSHNNRIKNSPGKPSKVDHAKLDELYMKYSDGRKIREAMLQDGRTLIVNIDDGKIVESPQAKALSSELIEIVCSPGVYAELASGGVKIQDSEGAYLVNVNSTRKSKVRIKHSPGMKAKDSSGIKVEHSPGADLTAAHFAKVKKSPEIKIKKSLNVDASGSGGSSVTKSDEAYLKDSPDSTHSTALAGKSINSPGSKIINGDENTIDNSPNATIADSWRALIVDSEGAGAYDAQALKMRRSPGTRAEVVQKSIISDIPGKMIRNKPHTVLVAKDIDSLPNARNQYKSRPGLAKSMP